MKFILIAAVALLALAHGSYAQDPSDLDKLSQFMEDMKNKMTEMISQQNLADQAESLRTQLEPMVAQVQEQLKTVGSNLEEHIRPLAANVQAQAQPMLENFQQQVEAALKKLMDQTQAIGN